MAKRIKRGTARYIFENAIFVFLYVQLPHIQWFAEQLPNAAEARTVLL